MLKTDTSTDTMCSCFLLFFEESIIRYGTKGLKMEVNILSAGRNEYIYVLQNMSFLKN